MKFKSIHFSVPVVHVSFMALRKVCRNFSWGPVVKNLPSSAWDVGVISGWGTEILHASGQLSPLAITREKLECGNKESLHVATKMQPNTYINIYI